MKLIQISAKNLKGLSFELGLKDVNFLVGTNFAGKSARTDAIRLLLVGFLPELGAQNSATFGLCSGRELIVEGEFDNGLRIKRRWYAKGDSIKSESTVPDEIANFGPLVVMLNSEEYFSLSERDRVKYVAENIPAEREGQTIPGILERFRTELLGVEDVVPKTVDAIMLDLKQAETEAAAAPDFEEFTPSTYLDHAIEAVSEIAKRAKDQGGRMEKTVQGLSQLRLRGEAPADVEALRAQREKVVKEIEEFQAEKAKHAAANEEQIKNSRRRIDLQLEVSGLPVLKGKLDSFEAKVAAIKAEIDALPTVDVEQLAEHVRLERESNNDLVATDTDLGTVRRSISGNEIELAGIEGKTECPYCGASGDGWKTIRINEINSTIAGLKSKQMGLEGHVANVREVRDLHAGKIRSLKNVTLVRDGRVREIEALEKTLFKETGFTPTAIRGRMGNLEAKREELERIPPVDPALVAAVETAQTALNVKNDVLRGIDAQIAEASSLAGELKRLAQAETDRDEQRIKETAAKEGAKILRAIQAEAVAASFSPLLEIANGFFGEVLKSPLAYHDGEIGSWREGLWVGHRTFSGTEKALAYAAIQIALASKSPVRFMILDELGRLDDVNVLKVTMKILQAVKANRLDGFVGIDVSRESSYAALNEHVEPSCQAIRIA